MKEAAYIDFQRMCIVVYILMFITNLTFIFVSASAKEEALIYWVMSGHIVASIGVMYLINRASKIVQS